MAAKLSNGSRLELRQEVSGMRYYVEGRGVHAGDILELRLFTEGVDGAPKWVSGRYEWNYQSGKMPTFHIFVGWYQTVTKREYEEDGREPSPAQAVLSLWDGAVLRWPEREA